LEQAQFTIKKPLSKYGCQLLGRLSAANRIKGSAWILIAKGIRAGRSSFDPRSKPFLQGVSFLASGQRKIP
jgi:hypothetical protein